MSTRISKLQPATLPVQGSDLIVIDQQNPTSPTGYTTRVASAQQFAAVPTFLANIAALRAKLKSPLAPYVTVYGYLAPGDGGGGPYYYDAADTTSTDNGGTIIVGADGGRWKLAHGSFIYAATFGAVGTADDTAAINAACTFVKSVGAGYVILSPKHTCNGTLNVDMSTTTILGVGSWLDTSVNTGVVFKLSASKSADPSFAQLTNSSHYIEGVWIKGPGTAVTTSVAFSITDVTTNSLSGFTVRNGACFGFYKGVVYSTGAYLVDFERFSFGNTATYPSLGGVSFPVSYTTGTNSGENFSFRSCYFGLSTCCITNAGPADFYFYGCSFDGFASVVNNSGGGSVRLIGGHVEGVSGAQDQAVWFSNTGVADTLTELTSLSIVVDGNKSLFAIGNSTTATGGIRLRDVNFVFGTSTYSLPYLITGMGKVTAKGVTFGESAQKIAIGPGMNSFPYQGTFETATPATSLNGLSLMGTPSATVDTSGHSHTGSNCLKIAPTTVSANGFSVTWPCEPGSTPVVNLYAQWPSMSGGGTAYAFLSWLDQTGVIYVPPGGSDTTAVGINSTIAQASYTNVTMAMQDPCPAGCYSFVLNMQIFGATTGSIMYVDDVVCNILNP